eukprot:6334633-Amphidinium_carterae.2
MREGVRHGGACVSVNILLSRPLSFMGVLSMHQGDIAKPDGERTSWSDYSYSREVLTFLSRYDPWAMMFVRSKCSSMCECGKELYKPSCVMGLAGVNAHQTLSAKVEQQALNIASHNYV